MQTGAFKNIHASCTIVFVNPQWPALVNDLNCVSQDAKIAVTMWPTFSILRAEAINCDNIHMQGFI